MTVYFAGESVSDFTENTNIYASDEGLYGSSIVEIAGGGSNVGSLFSDLPETVTTPIYFSFQLSGGLTSLSGAEWSLASDPTQSNFSIWDGEGNNIFYCGFVYSPAAFQGRIQLRDGTSADLDLGSVVGGRYDIAYKPGVSLEIWLNRIRILNYSGNVGNSASTVNGVGRFSIGNGDAYATPSYSNVMVTSFDTRFATMQTVTVNTTPTTDTSVIGDPAVIPVTIDEWSRGTYEVNNIVTFDTDGQKVIYVEDNTITVPDGSAVAAVVMSHSGFQSGTSPVTNLTPILEIGATEYTGAPIALAEAPTYRQTVFNANPATSATWTASDLEGLRYGFSLNT